MTPALAVVKLAGIIAKLGSFTKTDLFDAMEEAGIPAAMAERAYVLTQIAWGRVLLGELGVTFSPDYHRMDTAGVIVEFGLLVEEPYFIAATVAAKDLKDPGFTTFALWSAEVAAVNDFLKRGSKPETSGCCRWSSGCLWKRRYRADKPPRPNLLRRRPQATMVEDVMAGRRGRPPGLQDQPPERAVRIMGRPGDRRHRPPRRRDLAA